MSLRLCRISRFFKPCEESCVVGFRCIGYRQGSFFQIGDTGKSGDITDNFFHAMLTVDAVHPCNRKGFGVRNTLQPLFFRSAATAAAASAATFEVSRGRDTADDGKQHQNCGNDKVGHRLLLLHSGFRLHLLVGVVDDCNDDCSHDKNRRQTGNRRDDIQVTACEDRADGVNKV